jgi:hypothetical protein
MPTGHARVTVHARVLLPRVAMRSKMKPRSPVASGKYPRVEFGVSGTAGFRERDQRWGGNRHAGSREPVRRSQLQCNTAADVVESDRRKLDGGTFQLEWIGLRAATRVGEGVWEDCVSCSSEERGRNPQGGFCRAHSQLRSTAQTPRNGGVRVRRRPRYPPSSFRNPGRAGTGTASY